MIILPDINTSLEVVLGGAVSANQSTIVTNYHDSTSSAHTPGSQLATTSSTTAVENCAHPAASTERRIETVSMVNADTAAITATFRIKISGTSYILFKCVLQPGDSVQYEHVNHGWRTLNGISAIKEAAPTTGFRLLAPPLYANSITIASVPLMNDCNLFSIEGLGGGGGGGGAAASSTHSNAGGGGGGGAYLFVVVTPTSTARFITSFRGATGGTGGSNAGGSGNGGAISVATYNGVTYTAAQGSGGVGAAANSGGAQKVVAAGAVNTSTNGDINGASTPGTAGIVVNGASATGNLVAGSGGSPIFGGGAAGANANLTGNQGVLGGGGGGGASAASAAVGLAGGPGFICLRQYGSTT